MKSQISIRAVRQFILPIITGNDSTAHFLQGGRSKLLPYYCLHIYLRNYFVLFVGNDLCVIPFIYLKADKKMYVPICPQFIRDTILNPPTAEAFPPPLGKEGLYFPKS